jgi:uncharacterized protein (DUF1778 family)
MAGKKKKPEQVKGYMLRVRMTEEERRLLDEAAKAKSLQVSSWARSELLALARALLAQKAKG